MCENNCANYELNDLINNTLQLQFMNNFLLKDDIGPLLIINFDKINIILKHSSLYNYNNNNNTNQVTNFLNILNCDEGMTIDNIFFRIFTKVFPKCCGNNSNNITTNNNISESTSVTEENPNSNTNTNTNENLKKLLLINLYKMIPHLANIRYTKFLHEKINK